MSIIPGSVTITGFIAPTDTSDTYPVIDPVYGIDGLRSVADTTARNSVPDDRRRYGMIVFTQSDGKYWKLQNSPWSGTNTDWVEFTLATSSAVIYRTSFTNSTLSAGLLFVSHSIGQKYVQVTIYDNNDKQIIPDEVILQNTTDLQVDLTSYGVLTGTWNIVVVG